MAHTDRRDSGRGHPDDAVTDLDFGTDALDRISVTRDRVKALTLFIEQEQK